MGDRRFGDPPFLLARLVSKLTSSVKKSPIWGRRSGPPQYYNPINRQAGRSLNLSSTYSSTERLGSSVDCAPAVLGHLEQDFAEPRLYGVL
jgi:hypothetical protein